MEDEKVSTDDVFADLQNQADILARSSPRFHRRLTDKILAAFTHAYVMDEVELASTLYAGLVFAQDVHEHEAEERAQNQALTLAQYWIRLVDSKRRYEAMLSQGGEAGDPKAEQARNEMRVAFNAWYKQFETD